MRTTLRSKRFQFLLVPAHEASDAAIHRNTGPPDQSVEPLTISYNRISERLESAKRLHRYLNFADDGNHARLDASIARFVGFLRFGYFTIRSNPPWWSGSRPSHFLRRFEATNLVLSFSPVDPVRSTRPSSFSRCAGLGIHAHLNALPSFSPCLRNVHGFIMRWTNSITAYHITGSFYKLSVIEFICHI